LGVPLILLLGLIPILLVAMTPFLLIQRYRVGSSRRPARPWLATLAVVSMSLSALVFLAGSAFSSIWVPHAFTYAASGTVFGLMIGIAGVLVTRWEATHRTLHFTPNRWFVLVMTLLVSVRVLFGLYRMALAADAGLTGKSLFSAFGIAESLGAGGIVIGYYLAYSLGVRWRIRNWQRRALRPM
jgi:hypothetical protein